MQETQCTKKIPAVQFTYDFLCYIMLLIILNEFACLGKLVLDPFGPMQTCKSDLTLSK